jgi:glycosyltransferase 2 family protein
VLVASLILVLLLVLWIGPENLLQALKTADWRFILLATLIHLLAVWVRSVRWGFIIKQPREFRANFIVKTIGLFAGNFSPMRSAGEVLNAVAGKRINKISLSEGLSAGLTERFFDLAIVGALLILCAIMIPKVHYLSLIGGLLTLGIFVLVYFINWREDASLWLYGKLHPLISKLPIKEEFLDNIHLRLTEGLQDMIRYTNSFTSYPNLSFVFLLTALSWILECIRLFTVFYAFHVEISFVAVVIILLLANVIGVLSALPGGIGSVEISLTGLFIIFGVSSALAGSIALVDRLVSFWVVSALGIIFSSFYAHDILDEVKKYTLGLNTPRK